MGKKEIPSPSGSFPRAKIEGKLRNRRRRPASGTPPRVKIEGTRAAAAADACGSGGMADALVLGTSSLGVWVRPPSPAPRRSTVRFAPASFYARGKKDVIRPLPCPSFPTATRCAGPAVGGPPCGRHFSQLRNIDFNRSFQLAASDISLAASFFISLQSSSRAHPADPRFQTAELRSG